MATTHPAIFLKFLCKVPDPTPNLTKNEELTPADTETQGGLVTVVPQATLRSPSCTPRLCAVDFLPEKHMRRLTEEKCALGLEREKSICVVRLEVVLALSAQCVALLLFQTGDDFSSFRSVLAEKDGNTHSHHMSVCAPLSDFIVFELFVECHMIKRGRLASAAMGDLREQKKIFFLKVAQNHFHGILNNF